MFVVTLIAAIFGTIIYFRPATIATDCGADATFASNDCDCVAFAVVVVVVMLVVGTRVNPLPYKLLLSSFEFRLTTVDAIELVLDALLPLCNPVVCPVVLLFRDDRSRCFVVAAAAVPSDPT